MRRLVSSLEAEVIAIKTENSQLRCSLATASLTGPHTGVNSNHPGALASTSSFDYSIDSPSVMPVPPPINRQTTSHPPPSAIVNTSATTTVSSSSHRVENRQDRRRTMSSIDFRESQESNNKLPLKGDQSFSTTSNPIDVSRTASSRELLGRDSISQVENTTLISQPYRQQQQHVPPSHHDQWGHKMNDHDRYEHSNNNHTSNSNNNTSSSTSHSVTATTTTGNHNGQGLAVGQMVATSNGGGGGTSGGGGGTSGGGGGTSGGTGMQSLAQLIGGLNNGGGGVLTTNGGSMMSTSSVHTRRHSTSYEPSLSSSSLDKTENENYPRPVPNGATPNIGSFPSHYTHQTTQPISSMGVSRSLEQFTTMKPPLRQPQSQPNVPLTKGEILAFNAHLHANAMHTSGNINAHQNNPNSSSSSSSSYVGTNHSTHASDRTLPQHPPSSSTSINLNAWKQEGYPSEFAYAKAMGVLEISPTLSNNPTSNKPNNSNPPSQSVVSTIVPTIIRNRGQGQPMVSTTPFGTDDTVCQDLVAYDELEKHLTSMMSEKRNLNDESERLLQRGGKTLKERTRLTQVCTMCIHVVHPLMSS